MRFCAKCQHVKPEREFYRSGQQCKECKKAYVKEHNQKKSKDLEKTIESLEALMWELARKVEDLELRKTDEEKVRKIVSKKLGEKGPK